MPTPPHGDHDISGGRMASERAFSTIPLRRCACVSCAWTGWPRRHAGCLRASVLRNKSMRQPRAWQEQALAPRRIRGLAYRIFRSMDNCGFFSTSAIPDVPTLLGRGAMPANSGCPFFAEILPSCCRGLCLDQPVLSMPTCVRSIKNFSIHTETILMACARP